MIDEYLTITECAKKLNVSRQTVYNWMNGGYEGKKYRLPYSQKHHCRLIRIKDLLMASHIYAETGHGIRKSPKKKTTLNIKKTLDKL